MAPNRMSICALFAVLLIPWIGRADPSLSSTASANHPPVVSIQMENYSHGLPEHPPKWVFDPKDVAEEYKGIVETRNRLNQTMIAVADFHDTTVTEIFDFLFRKTGVRILAYRLPNETVSAGEPADEHMTFHLENISSSEVLRYASTLSGYSELTYANGFVAAKTPCVAGCMSMSAEFKAPAQFDGMPIKEYLLSRGIENFPWSKLEYDEAKGTLRASHSDDNLKRIAIILEGLAANPANIRSSQEIADSLDAWKNLEWKRNLELQIALCVEIHDAPLEKVVEELQQKVILWVAAPMKSKSLVNLSARKMPVTKLLQTIAEQTKTHLIMGLRFITFVPETQSAP